MGSDSIDKKLGADPDYYKPQVAPGCHHPMHPSVQTTSQGFSPIDEKFLKSTEFFVIYAPRKHNLLISMDFTFYDAKNNIQ